MYYFFAYQRKRNSKQYFLSVLLITIKYSTCKYYEYCILDYVLSLSNQANGNENMWAYLELPFIIDANRMYCFSFDAILFEHMDVELVSNNWSKTIEQVI